MYDESDVIVTVNNTNLHKLLIEVNITTQALDALLKPLTVDLVKIQDCTILEEGKENNYFTEAAPVIIPFTDIFCLKLHNCFVYFDRNSLKCSKQSFKYF